MSPKKNVSVVTDLSTFARARREIPLEIAQKYGGKHVAWDLSGARIVASGDSMQEVEQELNRQGLDVCDIVFDYIDPHDKAWIG